MDVKDVIVISEVHATSVFKVDPEDDGSMGLRNAWNFTHIHTAKLPKNRISINISCILQTSIPYIRNSPFMFILLHIVTFEVSNIQS
jgi:hypothetical protein